MRKNSLKPISFVLAISLSFAFLLSFIFLLSLKFTGNVIVQPDENYYWNGIKGIGINSGHYDDLQGIKNLNVTMVRDFIAWSDVEVQKGVYDFTFSDKKFNNLTSQGIEQLFIIYYSNCLYSNMPSNLGYDCWLYVPRNATQFQAFKKAFGNYTYEVVKHYKGKVKYFELWNEPNNFWEPSIRDELQASQYIELLKEGYKRAKEANPDAVILSAGLDTTDRNLIDLYIKNYYLQGAKDSFDILAVHPYCFYEQTYPVEDQGKTCDAIENIAYVKQIMDYYNDSDKKIWITEYGYPTDGCYSWDGSCDQTLSEDNQKIRMINLFPTLRENYPYVTGFFWYDYMDDCETGNPLDIECRFGLVRSDLSKKPAYYTYQNLSASSVVLSNSSSNQTQSNSSNQTITNSTSNQSVNTTTSSVTSSVIKSGSSSGGGGSGSVTTNSSESIISNNSDVSETEITESPASSGISGSGEKVSSSRDIPSTYKQDSKEVLTMTSAESNKCCASNSCYPVGKVIDEKYCDESSKEFTSQKEEGKECSNSFECLSNNCAMNKCNKENFISKIIKSIKGIFTK
jgi:polysaccharide biosynthesis protein PslG